MQYVQGARMLFDPRVGQMMKKLNTQVYIALQGPRIETESQESSFCSILLLI